MFRQTCCISVCVHYLLSCHWALLKRAWFHLCTLLSRLHMHNDMALICMGKSRVLLEKSFNNQNSVVLMGITQLEILKARYKLSARACLCDLHSVKAVLLHSLLRCLSTLQFSNSITLFSFLNLLLLTRLSSLLSLDYRQTPGSQNFLQLILASYGFLNT